MAEIMSHDEVPRKLEIFKNSWYALARQCEALSSHKSGLTDGFRDAVSVIVHNLRSIETQLDDLAVATQMHIPSRRADVEEIRSTFMTSLRGLEAALEDNLKMHKRFKDLSPKFDEVSKSLHVLVERYEDLKKHAIRLCDQYSQSKTEYEAKINNIKEATDRELGKIKEKFVAEVGSMFEGYSLVSKGRQEELTLDLLLQRLIQDPTYYQKIDVAHKGFFGRRRSDIEARLVLLGYKAGEVTEAIKPILEEEKRRLAKFEEEEKRINEMAIQCRDLRAEEKAMAAKKESLEKEVAEFDVEINGIKGRLDNYAKLAELVDLYVKKFGETVAARNKLTALVDASFKDYVSIEKDVEKRELKVEIKNLSGRVDSLESAKSTLDKELNLARATIKDNDIKISSLTQDLGKLNSIATDLKGKLEEITVAKKSLDKDLRDAKNDIVQKDQHINTLEDKVVDLTSAKASLEGNVKDLEMKLRTMKEEMDAAHEEKDENRFKVMELEGNYNILKTKYEDAASQLQQFKSKWEEVDKKLFDTQKARDIIDDQLKAKERDLRRVSLDVEKFTKRLQDSQDELTRYKYELQETSRKLIDESKAKASLQAEHDRLKQELEDVREEVKKLESTVKSAEAAKRKAVPPPPPAAPSVAPPVSKPKSRAKAPTIVEELLEDKGEEEAVVGQKISALRKKK